MRYAGGALKKRNPPSQKWEICRLPLLIPQTKHTHTRRLAASGTGNNLKRQIKKLCIFLPKERDERELKPHGIYCYNKRDAYNAREKKSVFIHLIKMGLRALALFRPLRHFIDSTPFYLIFAYGSRAQFGYGNARQRMRFVQMRRAPHGICKMPDSSAIGYRRIDTKK